MGQVADPSTAARSILPDHEAHSPAHAEILEYNGSELSGNSTAAKRAPRWEGQTLDGRFPLRQVLGGSVFLTEYEGRPAAIKVVTAAGRNADRTLARWRLASRVSHPNLIRLLEIGRSRIETTEVAYLVMEYADENLGQVLGERALTPEEAKQMLAPALDAIACIHSEGFIHGRLTPPNIMASGECLKISSDSLRKLDDLDDFAILDPAYRAPELGAGAQHSQPADIWTLGMTLIEVLTRGRPDSKTAALPAGVTSPLSEIMQRALRQSAQERATAAELAGILSGQPPVQKKSRLPSYAIAAAAILVAALVIWLITSRSKPVQEAPPAKPVPAQISAAPAAPVASAPAPKPERARKVEPLPKPEESVKSALSAVPSAPELVNQVMPDVLEKARRSIHGTLTLNARVHVDAYGAVTDAVIAGPAHSRYFSTATLKAVRRWKFRPVKEGDTFVPQEWTVRFDYTRDDTKVALQHVAK